VMRRHVWIEVETCGDCWTAEESFLIFIYTPGIPISLVSKPSATNRPILLTTIILSPTVALSVPYLFLFCLCTPLLRDLAVPYIRTVSHVERSNLPPVWKEKLTEFMSIG